PRDLDRSFAQGNRLVPHPEERPEKRGRFRGATGRLPTGRGPARMAGGGPRVWRSGHAQGAQGPHGEYLHGPHPAGGPVDGGQGHPLIPRGQGGWALRQGGGGGEEAGVLGGTALMIGHLRPSLLGGGRTVTPKLRPASPPTRGVNGRPGPWPGVGLP